MALLLGRHSALGMTWLQFRPVSRLRVVASDRTINSLVAISLPLLPHDLQILDKDNHYGGAER